MRAASAIQRDSRVFLGAVLVESLSLAAALAVSLGTTWDSHLVPRYLLALLLAVALLAFAIKGCLTLNKYELGVFFLVSTLASAYGVVKSVSLYHWGSLF
jgi:hypothetical protein